MLHLTWQALMHDRQRAALSALAAGAVFGLVLVFEGFWVGILGDLETFPRALPADLVVLQAGVETVSSSRSSLRQRTRDEVEAVPGVEIAHPLLVLPVILERGERRMPIQLVVFDSAGGPTVADGRPIEAPDELVLDGRAAAYFGLVAGDHIELMGHGFTLVGRATRSNSPFAPYAFTKFETLINVYFELNLGIGGGMVPLLGALLVELEPGADLATARAGIEAAVSDVDVYTPGELAENDSALGAVLLGPALGLLIGIAWVIALLTMSLTLYSTTEARLGQYAVVKAIGAAWGQIAGGMALHAVMLVAAGVPIGLLLSWAVAELVVLWTPLYTVEPWTLEVVTRAGLSVLAAALIGVLPAWVRVTRLSPDEAFRGAPS